MKVHYAKKTRSGDIHAAISIRCFAGDRPAAFNEVIVEPDGTVRVFDDVANAYTVNHSAPSETADEVRAALISR